ncbi:MAG: hypothetical protein U5R06_17000 [candidate division KSB1 bacterium]|nr:hypothetical protein [candidate division KSB1 bacterium]
MKPIIKTGLLPLLFLFIACSDSGGPTAPSPVFDGKITTESSVEVTRQEVSAAGGSVIIDDPSDPLHGFELTLPPDGFGQSEEFVISRAEITAHERGAHFNPVSPMISIRGPAGYSADPLTVKVPVSIPEDHFAMGFFYNEATGTLEPIPVEQLSTDFVTLSTRHLSPEGITSLSKRSLRSGVPAVGNLVISSIQQTVLDGQPVLSSGFKPGEDDWEFPNYGSFVCPGGHCAGQSMAAMWYYYEQKLNGKENLYAAYDSLNDPSDPSSLWEDNPRGYRFCSTLQKDQNFDHWVENVKWASMRPRLTYYSFITAMLLTGEPQYVLIHNSTAGGGHAMIVYQVTPSTGTLHIADPNFPNNQTRRIQYENGVLQPYSSAAVAGGEGKAYDEIGYAAKSTHIDWQTIPQRWAEFENGIIGDDRFPDYALRVRNGGGFDVTGDFTTFLDTLELHCRSTEMPFYLTGTDRYQVFYVYDDQGNYLGGGRPANHGVFKLPVKKGKNTFGFSIRGAVSTSSVEEYVDFKWITIDRTEDVDYSSVKEIIIGLLAVTTHWEKENGDQKNYGFSPTAGADVTFDGSVFTGTSSIDGDSVWVKVAGFSIEFFCKTRESLGSPGNRDVSFSGTLNTITEVNDRGFGFSATGTAVASALSTLEIDPPNGYTYLGYTAESNTSLGVLFRY